ncbi:MAG: hypothetical protein HZA50_06960 [Planctomycetes bacterium]|nr:hypothetical protein [Planctomycetota bacterium]
MARIATIRSGNTFGAIFWTDGRMQAPMLPELPPAARCEKCRKFFWIDEARPVGETPTLEGGDPWPQAKHVGQLSEDDFYEAIESGLAATAHQELILRRLAWWAGNDPHRQVYNTGRPGADNRQQRFLDNLRRMMQLLDEADDEQRLFKAEAARQIGLFSQAAGLLEKPFDGRLKPYADLIARLAAAGDSTLHPLP